MRVLMKHGEVLYRFATLEFSDRDGSIVLTLTRDGVSTFSMVCEGNVGEANLVRRKFDTPRRKDKKFSIHASGRINVPHLRDKPIFIEPLLATSKPFCFGAYRIPAISALTRFDKNPAEEDAIFVLDGLLDSPQSFEFIVSPIDIFTNEHSIKFDFLGRYSLTLLRHAVPIASQPGLEGYFTTYAADVGLFESQQMSEEWALTAFHQAVHNRRDLLLYEPNGAGVRLLVFSAPMRIAPRAIIECADPNLSAEIIDQTLDHRAQRVQLRFKVRNTKTREVIKGTVEFRRIELDAEL
ncbi:hypothetical protein ACFQUU_03590 [Herbaspirillum sp. GCM10030257]|uniref:hypothetical protein n=1 Tax=Herbaspirillum sp. GCM10030257 TaxID=3273393 RepID=UPI003608BC97